MKTILYLALLVFLLGGCSKDEEAKEIMYFKIHPEALSYIKFDPGKYYIYKDSASGRLDCVRVTKNSVTTRRVPASQGSWSNTPEYTTEYIQLTLHRYGDNVGTNWFKAEGEPLLPNYYPPFLSDDSASITLTELIDWQGGQRMYYGAFTSTSIPFPMIVEGVSYPSVMLGGYSSPSYYENSLREFYWAKNVGIIKKIIVLVNKRYVSSLVRHGKD